MLAQASRSGVPSAAPPASSAQARWVQRTPLPCGAWGPALSAPLPPTEPASAGEEGAEEARVLVIGDAGAKGAAPERVFHTADAQRMGTPLAHGAEDDLECLVRVEVGQGLAQDLERS